MTDKLVVEKIFFFTKSCNSENFHSTLSIKIKEIIEAEYGSYVWPSSVVLAQYIWFNKETLFKKSFMEIGSGTALPSIVACKCTNPSYVLITDKICLSR